MLSSLFARLDRRLAPAPDPARVAFLLGHDFAHRGWQRRFPENSLGAAGAALRKGFGIECDVRLARDGTVMVFHDADAVRMCGVERRIDTMNVAEIATLRLGDTEEGIPRLADLLARIAGRAPLLIEIKTDGPAAAALCLAVHRAIDGYGGPVAVMGFNPQVSYWFATHAPQTVRGLVMTEYPGLIDPLKRRLAVWRAKPDFLAYDIRKLPSALPAAFRGIGIPVLSWTVRTARHWAIVADHVDRPIFDRLP